MAFVWWLFGKMDTIIRKDVDIMCNPSQGIMEKGEAIGLEKEEKRVKISLL